MIVARLPVLPTQAELSAALLDPQRPCPPGLRAWNGADPAARLAVHRNNVVGSLIDALADTYPVVQQQVGEQFFRAMAGVFVRQCPPRSPILAHYGDDFPAFIAQFEPARAVVALADLARLELARVRSCHAADAEPLTEAAVRLALCNGEHVGELRLACHPSLHWIASPHAVVSLWAAHQGVGDLGSVDLGKPECALVVRQGLEVLVLPAPAGTATFMAAVRQGSNLGDAAATASASAAAAAATAAEDTAAFDLTTVLSLLLAHGALTGLDLPRRHDT